MRPCPACSIDLQFEPDGCHQSCANPLPQNPPHPSVVTRFGTRPNKNNENTNTKINPPITASSVIASTTTACVSGVYAPGFVASDVCSVITSTRLIDAISPTIKNGSHVSPPVRIDARTVCSTSINNSTNSSRSTIAKIAVEFVQSATPRHNCSAAPNSAKNAPIDSMIPSAAYTICSIWLNKVVEIRTSGLSLVSLSIVSTSHQRPLTMPATPHPRNRRSIGQPMSLYDFTARRITGETQSLADYRGQALLIVNVASRCGFTPQYAALQALHTQSAPSGFAVLAFPCNQFGHQEPGPDADIATFCDRTYGVTFPVFAKIDVNGPGAHPLYTWLKQQKGGLLGSAIKWNFTKFLIDRTGAVRARFAPTTTPQAIAPELAALL